MATPERRSEQRFSGSCLHRPPFGPAGATRYPRCSERLRPMFTARSPCSKTSAPSIPTTARLRRDSSNGYELQAVPTVRSKVPAASQPSLWRRGQRRSSFDQGYAAGIVQSASGESSSSALSLARVALNAMAQARLSILGPKLGRARAAGTRQIARAQRSRRHPGVDEGSQRSFLGGLLPFSIAYSKTPVSLSSRNTNVSVDAATMIGFPSWPRPT